MSTKTLECTGNHLSRYVEESRIEEEQVVEFLRQLTPEEIAKVIVRLHRDLQRVKWVDGI